MGSVTVNNECPGSKGLAELNHHMRDEHKEIRDGVMGEGQDLSEEDESRINEVAEDVNEGCAGVIQLQAGLQRPPQQTQGPVVRWERFLPLRSLKVLLVENDDSTRHVVSALLRNCSYEVIAVANGIQAWKILEDLTNHVDIVLTEVVMPCFSGINLLGKIMSHKTCKNTPVIMMSSLDSMGIVFKCLSKGAVDFLVKPIRKNELKNLWQHVWRRCHSSSGSGSESGIRTQKSVKSKNIEDSDNNDGSSDEDDNGSVGLNDRDGSDKGSGTQSSWTKRAVEVDSPQPMSPWDQLADPPDSTCAQVIHPKPETFGNEWVPMIEARECQEQDERLDNVAMGKDLEIGVPRNSDSQHKYQREKVLTNLTGTKQDKLPEPDPKTNNDQSDEKQLVPNSVNPIDKMKDQAADLIGAIANGTNPHMESGGSEEAPDGLSKFSELKDNAASDAREHPSLELSLKRREVEDVGIGTREERNVLRHSDLSAFSRYNTSSTANQAPTGNVGSCSPLDNSSEAVKTESIRNFPSHSTGTLPNQQSNGSSNNNDMGSTTNNAFTKPAALNEKSVSTSTVKCPHPSSAFQPLQNGCKSQQVVTEKSEEVVVKTVLEQPRGSNQQVKVQHHHHHYHHYHHHVHNSMRQQQQQQQQPPTNDELSLNITATPQCGSSNMFSNTTEGNAANYSMNGSVSGNMFSNTTEGNAANYSVNGSVSGNMFSNPIEGNAANYSVNGSVSGSNHGSNGQNGSSTVMNAGIVNLESDNGGAGKSGACGGSGSGSGVDQNRFAQREAALTKFRQKRKERCFEKKVRYQSRKRLAEQRPRIRGQFVRQVMNENISNQDADS